MRSLLMFGSFALAAVCAVDAEVAPAAGKWSRQIWTGLPGTTVTALTDAPAFYGAANSTALVDSSYLSCGDNYGARTRGYITAAVSGIHTFWVAGDDGARLLLSPDGSKWNARKVAETSGWTPVAAWDAQYLQRSASVYLEAGHACYVELLHKESNGGDHAEVAWAVNPVAGPAVLNWATAVNGAVAYASSNYQNAYPPANALDGSDASFFHTNSELGAWWLVDLGRDRAISSVDLVNRQGAYQERLSNFRVSIEDGNGAVVAYKDFYRTEGSVGAAETWNLASPVAGRRVKVQLLGLNRGMNYFLQLGEVRVNGPDLAIRNWAREAGVIATQSSDYSSAYPAAGAIDGNVNTFNHTANSAPSWLQVDLGADRALDTVELVNRQDSSLNRLSNFRLSILDGAGAVVVSQDFHTTAGSVGGVLRWELPAAVTGRKIRVELLGLNRAGNSFLHVAEVNGWGRVDVGTMERGLRAAVPAAVMSSYVAALTDDADDDGLLDSWEAAHGFAVGYESGAHGALADPDGDLRDNLHESRQNTDPFVSQGEPGFLSRQGYTDMPYYALSKTRLDARYFQAPQTVTLHGSALIAGMPVFSAGRIRGWLTPPETGYYRFWIASGEAGELWLSRDAGNRFKKEWLCGMSSELGSGHGVHFNSANVGAMWDNYGFQMSKEVWLEAGKAYFMESDYQFGHAGTTHVSLGWAKRGGERGEIPASCLASFVRTADDADDDGLPDAWESQYGLSATDAGGVDVAREGEFGDFDGDGLSNLSEYKLNTDPANADTDGDGWSDLDEYQSLGTNALVANAINDTLVANVALDSIISSSVPWFMTADGLLANGFRGEASWNITVPSDGFWLLRLKTELMGTTYGNESVPVVIRVDGKRVCRRDLHFGSAKSATIQALSPYLTAGTHTVGVMVDNMLARRTVRLTSLGVYAPSNAAALLGQSNRTLSRPANTRVSPACVEGYARDPGGVVVNGAQAFPGLGGGHWYANVVLAPVDGAQSYTVGYETGHSATGALAWQPTNAVDGESLLIRAGDSLRVGAWGADPTAQATVTIQQTAAAPAPSAYTGYLPTTAATAVVVANTQLAAVGGAGGMISGGWAGGRKGTEVCHFANDGSAATFQLQFYDGETYTKAVKVQLAQTAGGITAWQVYSRYKAGNVLGSDFDNNGTGSGIYSAPVGPAGYGVESLGLSCFTAPATHTLTGAESVPVVFAAPGTYTVAGSVAGGAGGTTTVRVVGAPGFGPVVDLLDARTRTLVWAAEPEVAFDADEDLCRIVTARPSATTASVAMRPVSAQEYGLVARLGAGGPVLAVQPVNVIGVSDAFQNDLTSQASSGINGYKIYSSPLTVTNFPAGAHLEISIFRAGVMFENGSTFKTILPEDLDNGSIILNFLHPIGEAGGYCHTITVFDRHGVNIGTR